MKHLINKIKNMLADPPQTPLNAPPIGTEVKTLGAPKLPRFYSVTDKKMTYVPHISPTAGSAGFYAIRATIFDRDSNKKVGEANGFFDKPADIETGIVKLTAAIKEKIEELYEKEYDESRVKDLLVKADVINNGLEWFYKK